MKTMPFKIDDMAADLSLQFRTCEEWKKSSDPEKVKDAKKLEAMLLEYSSALLRMKVAHGSCEVEIPMIDEEVDLFSATERAERVKKAISAKKGVNPTAGKTLPPIRGDDVDGFGLF